MAAVGKGGDAGIFAGGGAGGGVNMAGENGDGKNGGQGGIRVGPGGFGLTGQWGSILSNSNFTLKDTDIVAGIPFDQEIGLVLEGTKMGLNYGLDKVRFLSPVPVDSEVRIRMKCIDISEKNPGQYLAKTEVTMEIKGIEKPAFVAETLSMFVL